MNERLPAGLANKICKDLRDSGYISQTEESVYRSRLKDGSEVPDFVERAAKQAKRNYTPTKPTYFP